MAKKRVFDYTGTKVNKLYVVEKIDRRGKTGASYYKCLCDCGNYTEVSGSNLGVGRIKSCGCASKLDLSNQRFKRLVVLREGAGKINKRGRKYPTWICQCDCGNVTEVKTQALRRGDTKSCGCLNIDNLKSRDMSGENNPGWKGGKYTRKDGYVYIHSPNHPNAISNGYVLEHVKVMSEHIGRPLKDKENVHHKNGVKNDNRLENLELWSHSQPYGQRVEDKLAFAKEMFENYLSPSEKAEFAKQLLA